MNLPLHLTLYITETQFFINTSHHQDSNARTHARIADTCRGDLCKIFGSHSEFEDKTKIIDKFQI